MSDKLDKEKGRSIEELETPSFKHNHSTDIICKHPAKKERTREVNQYTRPEPNPATFSLDRHTPISYNPASVKRPNFEPSAEFEDNSAHRSPGRKPSTTDGGQPNIDHTPSHVTGHTPSSSPSLAPHLPSSSTVVVPPPQPLSSSAVSSHLHPVFAGRCKKTEVSSQSQSHTNTSTSELVESAAMASTVQMHMPQKHYAIWTRSSVRARVVPQEDEGTEGAEEAE
ncbi:uncharacterized protein STEHIDRAFT_164424 [Stereum hirsutum FP-91666 SS1]|uniref:uncharacterized protein n=1 Tax=Stereum hirsutum (strain FP-91666) TaxID=721885 RepID=UPI000440CB52|nr:uncharacterized protein STEHIDRAFT_164424 [Stereum hirsutum FP-91666 SS1]EIM92072.1 hypothetical protein STEHIDRAFT_164424 [Stereum hirsutum FP-91666 SS1]